MLSSPLYHIHLLTLTFTLSPPTIPLLLPYSICMVPMQTAFTDAFLALSAYGNLEIFDYCIDCLFFVDIVLNFNTGTYVYVCTCLCMCMYVYMYDRLLAILRPFSIILFFFFSLIFLLVDLVTAYYNDSREAYVIDRKLITANYLFSFWYTIASHPLSHILSHTTFYTPSQTPSYIPSHPPHFVLSIDQLTAPGFLSMSSPPSLSTPSSALPVGHFNSVGEVVGDRHIYVRYNW